LTESHTKNFGEGGGSKTLGKKGGKKKVKVDLGGESPVL